MRQYKADLSVLNHRYGDADVAPASPERLRLLLKDETLRGWELRDKMRTDPLLRTALGSTQYEGDVERFTKRVSAMLT